LITITITLCHLKKRATMDVETYKSLKVAIVNTTTIGQLLSSIGNGPIEFKKSLYAH